MYSIGPYLIILRLSALIVEKNKNKSAILPSNFTHVLFLNI